MAWEHSFSPEAYDDTRAVLESWTREDLCKALADFNYETFHGGWNRPGNPHHKGSWTWEKINQDPHIPDDVLVQWAMDCIETVRLCDNGGWAMWIDREGYHKVELPR